MTAMAGGFKGGHLAAAGAAATLVAILFRRRRPVACDGSQPVQGPVGIELRTLREHGE